MKEPLDSVRAITNTSSGRSGRIIAEHFLKKNHEVIFLFGKGSEYPESLERKFLFETFSDLDLLLQKILGEEKFDGIIHLAAVSDYSVEKIETLTETLNGACTKKLEAAEKLTVHLKRNFKIVDRIKDYAQGDPTLIAFKLTNTSDQSERLRAVNYIYKSGHVDFVIHNDMFEISKSIHSYRLIRRNGEIEEFSNTEELATNLELLLRGSK